MNTWKLLAAILAMVLVAPDWGADAPHGPQAEVAAALKGIYSYEFTTH